jgi:ABC-type multidrug transport system fused ATPase/permease subunit
VNEKHLTDDQLQEYLDGNLNDSDPCVRHLKSCPSCKRALDNYRTIYLALETEPAFGLSPEFVNNVMSRLPEEKTPAKKETRGRARIYERIIAFASIAAVMAAAFYFINPMTLIKSVFGWTDQSFSSGNQILNILSGYFSGLGLNPMMFLLTALTIITIAVIDYIISHRKLRHKQVSLIV